MLNKSDDSKRIVVAGGGFGGAYTWHYLHKYLHGEDGVKLDLINQKNYFVFTPLLHEVATGSVAAPIVTEPLRQVLGCCMNDFYLAEVDRVDLRAGEVYTTQGKIDYDYLVLALGSTTNYFQVPGAESYALALKTLADAIDIKNHFIGQFEAASKVKDRQFRRKLLRFVVVGGGPTGVEMAAEMSDFFFNTFGKLYGRELIKEVEVILIEAGKELLPRMPKSFRSQAVGRLRQRGVKIRLNERVKEVKEKSVRLGSGEEIDTATVIWVAGTKPRQITTWPEAETDDQGRLIVNEAMQLKDWSNVYALGDMARFVNHGQEKPAPALAQVATSQAKGVAGNIAAQLKGRPARSFEYQHAGDLLSLGRWMALAEIKGMFFTGKFAWWLWRTVYLMKLLSWRKKFKVAIDWTFDLFVPRDVSQV